MTRHRFVNDGVSPIPMGATAEYICSCGRRGTRAFIASHIAEHDTDDPTPVPFDFGGLTEAHYVPVEPREPAAVVSDARPPEGMIDDEPTPPELPPPPSITIPPAVNVCTICQDGVLVTDLPEIAAWSCGHWIRKKPQPIAESFQDMLRAAFQAGLTAATSSETFETWYQREVLR